MIKSKKIYRISNIICRNVLAGHETPVEAVLIRDEFIISGSRGGKIKIWDLHSGKNIKTLKGHTGSITSLDCQHGIIVSGSKDKTIRIWLLETGDCMQTLQGHTEAVLSVCISDNYIASGSDDSTVRIWNVENGESMQILEQHSRSVSAVKIFKNKLYSASWDHFLRIWDLGSGECLSAVEEHFDAISTIDVSENFIVTGDQTGYIHVWDRETLDTLHHFKHHRLAVMGVKIAQNYLYSTSKDKTILITDLTTGVCVKKLEGHHDATVGIDKQNNYIVSSSADKMIRIWDNFSIHSHYTIKAHEGLILGIKAQGNTLVSVGIDNILKVWDVKNGRLLKTIDPGYKSWIWGLAFDGNLILASSDKGIYRLYDLGSGKLLQELKGHQGKVYRAYIHRDKAITAGWDNTARVWDLNSGTCLHVLRGHTYAVYSAIITEDEKYITGSSDGTIRVWDSNGKEIREIAYHQDEIFHIEAEGDILVSASGDGVCGVFNYKTGEVIAEFDDHTDQVWTVLIHKGLIFTGSADNTIKIWDLNTKSCLDTLEGHTDNVKDLTISGDYLISGSLDSTIRIWDISKYFDSKLEIDEAITSNLESLVAQIQMSRTYDLVPFELGEPGLLRILYGMKPLTDETAFKHEKLVLAVKECAHSWNNLGRIGYAPWLSDIPRGIRAGSIPLEENESLEIILQKFLSGIRENGDLYWFGLLRKYQNNLETLLPNKWSFKLDFSGQGPNPLEGYEWIPLTSKINHTDLDDREETALVFRLTFQNMNDWILPLIKAVEIQLKDDRGDVNYIQFNNFIPNEKGEWNTTAMFKIDAGYKMEPTAIINITDIRVLYDEKLAPNFQGSNVLEQLSEIRLENQELRNKLEILNANIFKMSGEIASISLKAPPTKKKQIKNFGPVQKGYKLDELSNTADSMKVFKYVKQNFHEPRIGMLKVHIKEYFNKFLEYIQPKFILFTSMTSIVSALLSIMVYLHIFFPDQDFLGENILGSEFSLLEIIIYIILYLILTIILIFSIVAWIKYQFRKKK